MSQANISLVFSATFKEHPCLFSDNFIKIQTGKKVVAWILPHQKGYS